MPTGPDSVSQLMTEFRGGSTEAADKLVEIFYPELRRLASSRMGRERSDHTWQPTVLVHELYLELRKVRQLPPAGAREEEERDAFLGLSAFLMKRLLLHHARPLARRVTKTDLSEALGLGASGERAMQEVENLLDRLGAVDPILRAVVEKKVFEGLSREEIARQLNCSVRTVARHWEFAQFWLRKALVVDERS
jgi:RNA polymerase sigma factor (TIGR02999 family)